MHEEIVTLAARLTGEEAGSPLLEDLCTAAEAAWTARLREGVTAEDCGAAFRCAAAFTAAANLMGGEGGGTFRVGSVSVTTPASGGGDFRALAAGLMAPYAVDGSFAFRGVRG